MNPFLMTLDIGNTNMVVGIFPMDETLTPYRSWRTVTARDRTSDEMGVFIQGFLASAGLDPGSIGGLIYSSVVPSINRSVDLMARDYFGCEPVKVQHTMEMPILIDYPRPYEIGADRLVNAVGAHTLYPGNSIIVDLGTATTFCYLRGNSYLGGSIAPGLRLSMEALTGNTAKLSPIVFEKPPGGVLGDTTEHALQSGFYYGWVGLIKEITGRFRELYPEDRPTIIATGGFASLIHTQEPGLFDLVDQDLTLKGLRVLFQLNRPTGRDRTN